MLNQIIKKLWNRSEAITPEGFLDTESFKTLLRKERARADRRKGYFALVTIELQSGQPSFEQLAQLTEAIRLTDDIGWYDKKRIGVYLPDTEKNGAESFIRKVERLLERANAQCHVIIYDERDETDNDSGLHQEKPEEKEESLTSSAVLSAPVEKEKEVEVAFDASTATLAQYLAYPTSLSKRGLDILGASSLLLALSPLMIGAAIATRLSSKGPIFFRQQRVGKGGRIFTMYKFRSMVVGADDLKKKLQDQNEKSGPIFKMENDPRVTQVGRILRRTSIDELPQLWNVLTGNMSLVGPRPPTPDEVGKYAGWHQRRLDLVGGLTCFWQVGGRSEIDFEDWMRLDNQYLRQQSLWTDLSLLFKTPMAVLTGRGAK